MRLRPARLAVAVGAVGMAVSMPAAAAAPSAPSTPGSAWAGSAAADGVRVSVVVKDFLVVSNVVDAGGPAAQAAVSAFYGSQGLAAYPYPGEIVLTAHGLSQGAAPDYPLIASSNNANRPKSEVSQGPYDLTATSSDDESKALAQSVAGGGGAGAATTSSTAHVVHDPATGAVTASAESTLEGFSVAGVFSIGRIHSRASVSSPSNATKPGADTEFGDVTVGGQQVGVTDKGLVLAGTDVPLPPDSTANAILSGAGVTVHYVAATRTPTSVVAPGLSVSVVQNVPGVGQTTVTYLLGQAAATAQAASGATAGVAGVGGSTGAAGFGPASAQSPAGAAGAPSVGSAPQALTTAGGPAPAGAAPVTASQPGPANAGGYRLAGAAGPSSASLYVVLAVGAVVMAAAAQLFRLLAVRLAWT